jgi:hypothetical protein
MSIYIQRFANLNGVYDTQSTWIQAICEANGIMNPVNGSWIEALARFEGATGPVNGTWQEALVKTLGLELNGTWMQTLAESGLLVINEVNAYKTRVEAAGGIVEGYVCLTNKIRFLQYH